MDFPQFPVDFSKEARANVIKAEIRASRAVADEGASVQPALQRARFGSESLGKAATVVQYIMTVFAALAHEACELGKTDGGWAVDVVDSQVRELLRLTTIYALWKYGYVGYYLPKLTDQGWISAEAQALFEKTDEWKQYQNVVLEIAHIQASGCALVAEVEQAKTVTLARADVAAERKALLAAYKAEGAKLGILITDLMIAQAASQSWHDRTPVQRWKQSDTRCTQADDARIRKVLKDKPHLR